MRYYADLHVHSKYSRACSRDCDLEHLAWWARRKGITVLGTGDVTHPAWAREIATKLVPAEPGLFQLREDLDRDVLRTLPPSCHGPVRFVLEVEISTIYKRADRTRKVHHLCYLPDLDAMAEFTKRLSKIGNLGSDGRPILGLDSRDLLEITLESGPDAYLIPAHAWTPWFAVLGSKSGFDAIEDCYVDLADHIFAVETGLSSNPEMNWRVSRLDRFRLVSNSDAHSPPILGRNATVLDTELGYQQVKRALVTGDGYMGTVDMFPEEGKYHHDGHRKCGVRLTPEETRSHNGNCPACGKPLTVGVLYRVEELADNAIGRRPDTAGEFLSIVPLPEIVGEILGVGPKSKTVSREVHRLVGALGPELGILLDLPLAEIATAGSDTLVEAIERLRSGRVYREPGYDGEYGKISLFEPGELDERAPGLFGIEPVKAPSATKPVARRPEPTKPATKGVVPPQRTRPGSTDKTPGLTPSLLDALDADQRLAAESVDGPLLIVAGPGTGKTRTLTHRLAHLITTHGVRAGECLAITFTRRACEEMRTRLASLIAADTSSLTVATFHGFGRMLLCEQHAALGLPAQFGVADEETALAALRTVLDANRDRDVRRTLAELSAAKRQRAICRASGIDDSLDPKIADTLDRYTKALTQRALVDFDDLIALPVTLLAEREDLVSHYRSRFRWICVDEYQDVDESQYHLLRLLAPQEGNLCAIGDPDQAIYSFRGADVGFFLRFQEDFPTARTVSLTRNYRSSEVIVAGALAAIAPGTLVPDRALFATSTRPAADRITVYRTNDENAEARFVVGAIEELLGGSSFHSRDSGLVDSHGVTGGLSFDDIAVLYRTDAQSRPVMAALARAGLPYQKRSHNRLAAHAGVRAILSLLPMEPTGQPLLSMLSMVTDRAAEVLLASSDVDSDGAPETTMGEAIELLAPFARQYGADVAGFRAELALGAEVDTWDPRANRISLLTLHAAKGLEFPVVFIVGCADGLLPLRWAGGTDAAESAEDIAEERRLFFVGISRAQSHLYLSYPTHRVRAGQSTPTRISPFLAALGDDLARRDSDVDMNRVGIRGKQLRLL